VRPCYSFLVGQDRASSEYIFYDGHCGLCHGAVKFALKHEGSGGMFRFAPLQGETFRARVTPERRVGLPDSVVVLKSDGTLLMRSDAILYVMKRMGGAWRVLAAGIKVIPHGARDFVYNMIARIRFRVFGRREDLCPVVPPELRARFDL
jgi:predicted DCC family thiol-disulfide oxidoreductase YuxK